MWGSHRRRNRSPNDTIHIVPAELEFLKAEITVTKRLEHGQLHLIDISYRPNRFLKQRLNDCLSMAHMGDRFLRIRRFPDDIIFEETISYYKANPLDLD